MEEERSHMTTRILNLTLEILYLLTGESLPPLKPDEHLTITVPPSYTMNPERHNMGKILEVTKKIIELLTGEVRNDKIAPGKVERGYLEGHKDLYKDVMMEDEPDGSRKRNPPKRCPRPLEDLPKTRHHQSRIHEDETIDVKEEDEEHGVTVEIVGHKDLQDGSRKRNPPQRCPRPRDPTQEHYIMVVKDELEEEEVENIDEMEPKNRSPPQRCPHPLDSQDSSMSRYDQGEDLMDIKIEVKVEEEEEEEEMYVMVEHDTESGEMMVPVKEEEYQHVVMEDEPDGSRKRNPSQRCPRPPEDLPIPHQDQYEKNTDVKAEDYTEEEIPKRGHRKSTEDVGVTNTMKEVEMLRVNTTGEKVLRHSWKERHRLPSDCEAEDNGRVRCSRGPRPVTVTNHGRQHRAVMDSTHSVEHFDGFSSISESSTFPGNNVDPPDHEEPFHEILSVPDVEENEFSEGLTLVTVPEKPYCCSECGKHFAQRQSLTLHMRLHFGKRSFQCPECGKSFREKLHLLAHQAQHTGERPFACAECGKSFVWRRSLERHRVLHTGERPYTCTVCGKSFARKDILIAHQRSHTDEKPFSCLTCGKCFSQKSHLWEHQSMHTLERPFSCSVCGKAYKRKVHLTQHQRKHKEQTPGEGIYGIDEESSIL